MPQEKSTLQYILNPQDELGAANSIIRLRPFKESMSRESSSEDIDCLLNVERNIFKKNNLDSPQNIENGIDQNSKKQKSKRRRLTSDQQRILMDIFNHTSFPSTSLREALANKLDLSPRTIQIWFQNKRQAYRAKNMKLCRNRSWSLVDSKQRRESKSMESVDIGFEHRPRSCPEFMSNGIPFTPRYVSK